MMREYVSLNDSNYMSSKDHDILNAIMFNNAWPDVVARKTTAGDFTYDVDVQSFLCSMSNLPWEAVNAVIQGLRRKEYNDLLREQVSLIFDRVDVMDWQDFLDPTFMDKVEERIIFNERNSRTRKIAKMSYALVAMVIDSNGSLNYLRLLSMSQAKAVIVYILVTNIILYASIMDEKLGLAA